MSNPIIGRLVAGEEANVLKAYEAYALQPVTETRLTDNLEPFGCQETTLAGTESAETPPRQNGSGHCAGCVWCR